MTSFLCSEVVLSNFHFNTFFCDLTEMSNPSGNKMRKMSKVVVVRAAAVDLQKFRFDQEFQCMNPQICPRVYLAVSGIVSEHQSLES